MDGESQDLKIEFEVLQVDGEWQDLKIKFESTLELQLETVTERPKSPQMPTWLLQQSLALLTVIVMNKEDICIGGHSRSPRVNQWTYLQSPSPMIVYCPIPVSVHKKRTYIWVTIWFLTVDGSNKLILSHPIASNKCASPASLLEGKESIWQDRFGKIQPFHLIESFRL